MEMPGERLRLAVQGIEQRGRRGPRLPDDLLRVPELAGVLAELVLVDQLHLAGLAYLAHVEVEVGDDDAVALPRAAGW